jgi:hypothetical protein
MAHVSGLVTSKTSSDDNDFAGDVYYNDNLIAAQVNGNIDSTNLADGAVTTAKIADASVTAAKLSGSIGTGDATAGYAAVATEQTTASASFTDLATVGPSVSITVPTNGIVKVFAQVAMKTSSGTAEVGLYEATDISTAQAILSTTNSSYETRNTTPDSDDGTTTLTRGGALSFPATAGARTFTLKYKTSAGTATFQTRKLWVVAFDPS